MYDFYLRQDIKRLQIHAADNRWSSHKTKSLIGQFKKLSADERIKLMDSLGIGGTNV